jgi:anthranilate phosphoribosyltransferase
LVKGLEGSCDLSRSRTGIIALSKSADETGFERLLLDPSDYGLNGSDIPLESNMQAITLIQEVINGKNSQLFPAAILNGGFYLWRFGIADSLESGFSQAEAMLTTEQVAAKLIELQTICSNNIVSRVG